MLTSIFKYSTLVPQNDLKIQLIPMIHVDEKLVKHLAHLSRIGCPEEKVPAMVRDLENIVGYFEELIKVNTDDVQTCSYVSQFIKETPLREDIPCNTIAQEEFLKGTSAHIAQLVRIPTVMKDS